MRPQRWQPPVELSQDDAAILRRIHRAKLFVFLREQRHQLFTPDFQDELAHALYADKPKGHLPITAEMPHGGFKQSGFGKDMSPYALEDYTQVKHIMRDNTGDARKGWHYTIFGDAE